MSESRGTDAIAEIRRELVRAERRRATALKRLSLVGATVLVVAIAVATTVGAALPQSKETTGPPSRDEFVVPKSPESKIASPEIAATRPRVEQPKLAPAPKLKVEPKPAAGGLGSTTAQNVPIRIGTSGFEPSVVRVKAGVPVTLAIDRGEGCAAGFLIPDLGISADNSQGPVTVKLPALRPGTYRFSCGMEMVTGTLVVG